MQFKKKGMKWIDKKELKQKKKNKELNMSNQNKKLQ